MERHEPYLYIRAAGHGLERIPPVTRIADPDS